MSAPPPLIVTKGAKSTNQTNHLGSLWDGLNKNLIARFFEVVGQYCRSCQVLAKAHLINNGFSHFFALRFIQVELAQFIQLSFLIELRGQAYGFF